MNWYKRAHMDDNIDLYSGNCGMYAIALGKMAQEQNKKVVMIVSSNMSELDDFMYGEPKIYHIGVEIDGEVFDGNGKTTLNDIAKFSYDTYGDSSPQISFLDLNDAFITFVRTQTNWEVSWEEFYNKLKINENKIVDDNNIDNSENTDELV